jgi:hypothetical protein
MAIRSSRIAILLAALAVESCAPSTPQQAAIPEPASDTTTEAPSAPGQPLEPAIHFTGFGPIHAGMTLAEAEQSLGAPLAPLGPRMDPCYYVQDPGRSGVAFMVIEGRIARVDVQQHSAVRTIEGAGIGDTEERIRALYPGLVTQPHKYVDGHYLIVRPAAPADTSHRIVFETDGQRVTRFRAGRMPEVRWVEGCS